MLSSPLKPAFAILLALASVLPAGARAAETIEGKWRDSDGTSIIVIGPCKPYYCASILWTSKGDRDALNENPALRNRPLVGMPVIWDLKRGDGNVWTGTGYNPNDGKTYGTKVSVKSASEIEIGGCILGGIFCDSDVFARVN